MAESRNRISARSSILLLTLLRFLALAILMALFEPAAALAHASLVGSTPAQGAVIATPPRAIVFEFNEAVAPLVLTGIAPGGSSRKFSATADGTRLVVSDPDLQALGTYLFSFRVISDDGHTVVGTIAFSVGAPSASPGTAAERKSPPALVNLGDALAALPLFLLRNRRRVFRNLPEEHTACVQSQPNLGAAWPGASCGLGLPAEP
ncbi:copper resistance protein CopC (plasmid) [Rhizobium sullae]|uniref:Copper resistance protein CopC n=1 Tax=Rhizobium sullae TaxID=50338 RepID=A0A2N0DHH3_RHISU|nr:copper resistance CopC family protein [Rhizobium sullae]PKA45547.1 hypothetical protein CWR43_00485 [Rhizobium sullae]UWU18701.1 copper resistance protein CopC [Rhizobium sullae]